MTCIYDHHRTAFANVSAYVVLKDGERVATVAFKFGTAVTAYVHFIGAEMVRATAKGGGYDRQSAAVAGAAHKHCDNLKAVHRNDETRCFWEALHDRDGRTWDRRLQDAGFTVLQAV